MNESVSPPAATRADFFLPMRSVRSSENYIIGAIAQGRDLEKGDMIWKKGTSLIFNQDLEKGDITDF
jgi:hypothetical protein